MTDLRKGNIVLLKRPLADFICVVQWVDGEEVSVRYLDSPRDASYSVVKKEELIKLGDDQEKELPTDFLSAIEGQRKVVFQSKRRETSLATLLKGVSEEKMDEILKILVEDGSEIK